jgi:hypothetical protein
MNFLITGDSWSQGEWLENRTIAHKGLEQYLLETGHKVLNVGRGGQDNYSALYQASCALWEGIDHFIFFQTDILRSCNSIDLKLHKPMETAIREQNCMVNQLNDIRSKNPNLKITVIGGCGKFDEKSTSAWDYCVPSMTALLVPGFVDNPYWVCNPWYQFLQDTPPGDLSFDHKLQILEIEEQIALKKQCWNSNKDLFYPDGLHPNRQAHKFLFEHLCKLWNFSEA